MAEDAVTILVVDDDPIIRRLVGHGLRGMGFDTVLEAADGVEAQSKLGEQAVDLVITDLLMPRLDGLGLIRWANDHHPGLSWIILSGVDTFDAAVEAIQVGAFDFLSKPPRLQELEVAVRNALEHRQLLVERARLFAELEQANRDLARKLHELEEKSEIIRRDLERAEVIQRALLPAHPPPLENHSLATIYRPGEHVGGDLYNVATLGERHLAFYVADATGHGVSSAMLSVLFHRRLKLMAPDGVPLPPAAVLELVNRALCESAVAPGLFLTAAYCLLDLESGDLAVASAGHPPVLLQRASGERRRIERTGPALGLVREAVYTEVREQLRPGDRVLLFTDGLVRDGASTQVYQVLERSLSQMPGDCRSALAAIFAGLQQAAENGAAESTDQDDTTLLMLEASAGASHFDNAAASSGGHAATTPRPAGAGPVWYGESEDQSYLVVRGRGTWMGSDAFYATALNLLESGRPLVIDLSDCEYLDSTFLGTIHEVVTRFEESPRARATVQGADGAVKEAFEELGMERMLHATREPASPLPPQVQPLSAGPVRRPESQLRMLRAHEELASLSARNREKFLSVVETIRSQLQD
jgi:serine phosphatase RsbU (regulator of sigma subunit)/anti-anti-sigma regulatory factor